MGFDLEPWIGKPFDLESQVRSAIEAAGLRAPDSLILDGKIHRFNTDGHRDKSGWYIIYPDGLPAGCFGCWRQGIEVPFRAEVDREIAPEERALAAQRLARAREMRDAERARARQATAEIAGEIWESCDAADPLHPYLERKGIQPNGARQTLDGRLVVPLYSPTGELSSLQYIDAAGHKLYHLSGQTGGCYWVIGGLSGAKRLYLAEGFATAATIHEATGQPVAVAYSASNLVPVCGTIVGYDLPVVIVADNDKVGVGLRYAEQAAAKFGVRYVVPPDVGDANDFAMAGGDLLALLEPAKSGWLVPVSELLKQPTPLKWLIRGWLPQQSFSMFWGPPGKGKTFAVIDWALRISSGVTEWCGAKITQFPVVYLAGEGHRHLASRVAAWHHQTGVAPEKFWISKSGCDLDTNEGYLSARDAILETGEKPGLIIIDTLHRFLAGDENKPLDVKRMADACGGLMREFGATILLVHHSGVSDEAQHRYRGSSAWKGALDTEFSLIPSGDDLVLSAVKMKDGAEPQPVTGRLVPQGIPGWVDDEGEPVGSVVFCAEKRTESVKVQKQDNEVTRAWQTFSKAWWGSGAEVDGDCPVISRAAMLAKMRENGLSSTQAQTQIRADKNGVIGILLRGEIVETTETGWKVISQSHASALLVRAK